MDRVGREFLLQLLLHPSSAVSLRLLLDLLQLVSMTSTTLSVFIQGLLLAKCSVMFQNLEERQHFQLWSCC